MRSIHVLAAVFIVACSHTPAMATSILAGAGAPGSGDPFVFNFDENGNATYNLCIGLDPTPCLTVGPPVPVLGSLQPDPFNSDILALRYALPEFLEFGQGDVGIYQADGITPSDGLRFVNIGFVSYMFFYSADIGGGALADIGLGNLDLSFVGATERADDSFQYCPGDPCSTNNIYNGQSTPSGPPPPSAVPEPSSILLLLGGGIAGFRRLRSRKG
jgi:hypothetical protein